MPDKPTRFAVCIENTAKQVDVPPHALIRGAPPAIVDAVRRATNTGLDAMALIERPLH